MNSQTISIIVSSLLLLIFLIFALFITNFFIQKNKIPKGKIFFLCDFFYSKFLLTNAISRNDYLISLLKIKKNKWIKMEDIFNKINISQKQIKSLEKYISLPEKDNESFNLLNLSFKNAISDSKIDLKFNFYKKANSKDTLCILDWKILDIKENHYIQKKPSDNDIIKSKDNNIIFWFIDQKFKNAIFPYYFYKIFDNFKFLEINNKTIIYQIYEQNFPIEKIKQKILKKINFFIEKNSDIYKFKSFLFFDHTIKKDDDLNKIKYKLYFYSKSEKRKANIHFLNQKDINLKNFNSYYKLINKIFKEKNFDYVHQSFYLKNIKTKNQLFKINSKHSNHDFFSIIFQDAFYKNNIKDHIINILSKQFKCDQIIIELSSKFILENQDTIKKTHALIIIRDYDNLNFFQKKQINDLFLNNKFGIKIKEQKNINLDILYFKNDFFVVDEEMTNALKLNKMSPNWLITLETFAKINKKTIYYEHKIDFLDQYNAKKISVDNFIQ